MADNSQSRKWALTINNPLEHGFTDEVIKETLQKFALDYYCMCKEIGNETQTLHIHIFIYSKSPIRFSTIQSRVKKNTHQKKNKGTKKKKNK